MVLMEIVGAIVIIVIAMGTIGGLRSNDGKW